MTICSESSAGGMVMTGMQVIKNSRFTISTVASSPLINSQKRAGPVFSDISSSDRLNVFPLGKSKMAPPLHISQGGSASLYHTSFHSSTRTEIFRRHTRIRKGRRLRPCLKNRYCTNDKEV